MSNGGRFRRQGDTYYGRWTYKYEEAPPRRRRRVGSETDPASYGWATVKNSNTNAMFDIVRKKPRDEHAARRLDPARLAAQLFAAPAPASSDEGGGQDQGLSGPLKATSMSMVTPDRDHHFGDVVGCSRTARPNETVIYTGHWDIWESARPTQMATAFTTARSTMAPACPVIEQGRAFARGPGPAVGGVPRRDRGGKGPAWQRIYAANPLYPAP